MYVWRTCFRCMRRYNKPRSDKTTLCKTCALIERRKPTDEGNVDVDVSSV